MSASVLFDIPGPKARLRYRLYAVLGIVVLVAGVGFVLYRFADSGQFDGAKWTWLEYKNVQTTMLDALWNTIRAFLAGAVLAMVFGAIFAAGQLSDHKVVRVPAMVVVELFRAVPLVVLIFIFHYGIGLGAPFYSVVLGLTLYNGSVLAEVFRAGVLSLPRGQSEAAYAVGMRKTQVMTLVLLPQAVRAMLPAIISQLVVLLKDSALGFLITYEELLYQARYLGGIFEFGRPLVPITIVVAAIYIAMCLLLTWFANYLEKRNRRNKKVIDIEAKPAEDVVAAAV
ncbi:amino acid ABC transporter permease [Saccharothrix variisporea]|uniref:Amino acid ABC transporter membrane protein 2 (PAAT family) n=1 Tax=Saccharothrix variisporea TaxID=543527 RepID=A0A495X874_9PSEU|nr:amino acid ABC transporter permease [Saccharothrix variisporea]RKT69769.1 amino acid ABC transporter membrane protein 2 (PAAT family) [Saccharothrix variisporea]